MIKIKQTVEWNAESARYFKSIINLSKIYFINVKHALLMYEFIYFYNSCNLFYLFVLAFKNGISFPVNVHLFHFLYLHVLLVHFLNILISHVNHILSLLSKVLFKRRSLYYYLIHIVYIKIHNLTFFSKTT